MRRFLQIVLRLLITPIVVGVGSLSLPDLAAGPYPYRIWLSTIVSILASALVTIIWIRVERTSGQWFANHLRYCAILYLVLPFYVMTLQEGLTAPGGRIATIATMSAILVNGGIFAGRSWLRRKNVSCGGIKLSTGTT